MVLELFVDTFIYGIVLLSCKVDIELAFDFGTLAIFNELHMAKWMA